MASNALVDATVDISKREVLSSNLSARPLPGWDVYKHTRPDSKPTPPAFPGALSAPEQAEVEAWMDGLVTPTLAAAITWVGLYETFNAAMDAWKFADHVAREAQYYIAYGDGLIKNKGTTSASADDTGGGGSSPPPHSVYPREDP